MTKTLQFMLRSLRRHGGSPLVSTPPAASANLRHAHGLIDHPVAAAMVLTAFLVGAATLGLVTGPMPLTLAELWYGLWRDARADAVSTMVIWDMRLPRVLLGALIGAALAMAGATLQGLFRNPLADPGLIGVTSGAAFGAVAFIVLGGTLLKGWADQWGSLALPLAAFLGGVVVVLVSWRIARRDGGTDVTTLLLCGVAINAIAGAGTGVLTYVANDEQLRSLTFWTMGSLAYASWSDLQLTLPWLLAGLVGLPLLARPLNAFLLGESVAGHLGYSVQSVKRQVVVLSALTVGAAVAVAGPIGFVGLVIPHWIRHWIGADHRVLLPLSALAGAALLVAADCLAKLVVAPAELPIGLVMALLGGPTFLAMLMRRNQSH